MDKLREFWTERAPREKLFLGAAAGLVLIALLYLLLIEPAATGIARLNRGLVVQRQQAAKLDSLLVEVKNLKSRGQVATLSAAEARGAVEKSLAAAGLKATRVVPLADGDLQLTFSNVPYAGWSLWLAGIERELGARAGSVTANGTATPGHVDIEVALRMPRRG
ncbi:MAG TPA: type II secretion system protein GspM [Burkholderiaceae bacterium]|nr:type II secretion system protein GspM [Burkholderiaceae bacterium]